MVNGLVIVGYLLPLVAMLATLFAAVWIREREREAEARVRASRRR